MEKEKNGAFEKRTEIKLTGKATLQSFEDKENARVINFVAVEIENPFESGTTIRLKITNEKDKAIFDHEAKKILVLTEKK